MGGFDVDEHPFGARRVRGKRGRGGAGKTPVFGLLKRGGHVFVKIVSDCTKESLIPIIQGPILEGATIYSDGWKANPSPIELRSIGAPWEDLFSTAMILTGPIVVRMNLCAGKVM